MDKIQNLHDLEYFTNISLSCELALKWSKARPKNKEVQALSKALTDIAFYVNRIQGDLQKHKVAISDYRLDKNEALLKYNEIKDKFDNLKKLEI
ncbi:MAG: hypothetical protein Tp1102DCM384591_29 [Prokaryotic dsDNA virus sp.]|mgnify:FL=1|jgi:hypothetical protein|nr:MAG: hypothetical protein Tp1102DCM384591_29 [Prokaryotic dsDNA virus sp.]|tara:strand:+ start:11033 stop:11314 length:282 start_codon:yes stop_codon:yes gene_type:complete